MAEITQGNIMVMNEGRAVLTGFNFMLRVEALFDMPLKAVRSFTRELEFDYIQEGGLNDYVHMRRKGISKPYTFEVDRYVGINYIDPLPLGANLLLPLVLMVSRIPGQFIPLVSARTYTFTGCTVMKKTFGELDGNKSDLLIETVTIAYRELVVLDAPWSEAAGEPIDEAYKSSNALSDSTEEKALRARCDKVVAECDLMLNGPLNDPVTGVAMDTLSDYKAKVDKMPDGNDESKTDAQNEADKAAKKKATDDYTAAKKAVDDARHAAFSARSFTMETELEKLTEAAEAMMPAARTAFNTLPEL